MIVVVGVVLVVVVEIVVVVDSIGNIVVGRTWFAVVGHIAFVACSKGSIIVGSIGPFDDGGMVSTCIVVVVGVVVVDNMFVVAESKYKIK